MFWRPVRLAGLMCAIVMISHPANTISSKDEAFVIRVRPNFKDETLGSEVSDSRRACAQQSQKPSWPRLAPASLSDWISEGWCNESLPCPDKLLSQFVRKHNAERQSAMQSPVQDRRFLACKPMGGIGNWISGLMSCFAAALMTNRSLLLASPPPTPPDKTTSYDEPVESLFDFPIDLSLSVLGDNVKDIPFLVENGAPKDTAVLQMLDIRTYDFLCSNLSSTLRLPVVVMPAHLWLGALPQNHNQKTWLAEHFGADPFGIVPFFAMAGSWMIRPKTYILNMVHSLADTLMGFSFIYGIQARVGITLDATNYNDRPPPESGPEYVRCAYAYAPPGRRAQPSGWIVAGDQARTKVDILTQIAHTEGPIIAAANELGLREMGLSPQLFAAQGSLGARTGSIEVLELDSELLRLGFAMAVFASGSRALVLAQSPTMTSRDGMVAAVIEMWLLSYAILIVVTENSTFWVPAVSFMGPRSAGGGGEYVFTTGRRCYPLPSTEPPSDAGYRSRSMTSSKCYEDTLLNPASLWLPPK